MFRTYTVLFLLLTASATTSFAVENAATTTETSIKLGGVDHVGLTVRDLNASEAFFTQQIGFRVLGRDPSYPSVFLSDGNVIVTLWQAVDPKKAKAFDRKNNVGLHHLAFRVRSFEQLDSLYQQLSKLPEVVIEFAPELLGKGPTKHMMIREPSGNRIEFIHRP